MKTLLKTQITYTSFDRKDSGYTLFENTANEAAPLMLILPALGAEAAYYEPFARRLVAEGFHVITADWRGKGLSAVRASRKEDFGYREVLHYDLPALFDSLRRYFPDNPITVFGHSLGGQLASLYLAAHPEENVRGLVLQMACHCHYRNWTSQRRKILFSFLCYPLLARLWGYFPGRAVGFGGREARTFMRDWAYSGLKGKYHPKGLFCDYDSLGNGLRLPVLAFSLEGDWLAPRPGVEQLCRLFPNAPVQHFHLEKGGHGQRPLSHFNWVHQPGAIIEKLKAWEEGKLPARTPEQWAPPATNFRAA